MKISQLVDQLQLTVIQDDYDDREIVAAYTSDLLSDVMANAGESDVLITIQAHKNTVAVASLVDMAAVVICNDRNIPEDMVVAATRERIGIFRTARTQFRISGEIFVSIEKG